MVETRVGNFLGFEFLVRNEELFHNSHEEQGIFEESFNTIFAYTFYYKYYLKGHQNFYKKN